MAERVYSAVERANETHSEAEGEAAAEERIADFPVECLPAVLERQTRAISELCGTPFSMAAPMVLATASISIGKGLVVRGLGGRVTRANIYVLVCKTSGSGGTVTFRHATAPLVGMQQLLRREYDSKEKPRVDAEHATLSSLAEELKRKSKKAQADERQQLVDELTEVNEKLAEIERRVSPIIYVTDVT